jgi:hypothetical protein
MLLKDVRSHLAVLLRLKAIIPLANTLSGRLFMMAMVFAVSLVFSMLVWSSIVGGKSDCLRE